MHANVLVRFAAVVSEGLIPYGALALLLAGAVTMRDANAAAGVWLLLGALGTLVYALWWLLLYRTGRTPGKVLFGLQVVSQDSHEPVGFWRMVGREIIGKAISSLVFGLGWLWALVDPQGQTWHDKMFGTVVVRMDAATQTVAARSPTRADTPRAAPSIEPSVAPPRAQSTRALREPTGPGMQPGVLVALVAAILVVNLGVLALVVVAEQRHQPAGVVATAPANRLTVAR